MEIRVDEEKWVRRKVEGAMMMRVAELNEKYEANDYHGIKGEGDNYQVILGRVPVIVSAPHAVCQVRDGVVKDRDGMTGGIVEYLCEKLGVIGIVRRWEEGDDPNYAQDERSEAYREQIIRLVKEYGVKWVFDIHGCLNKHGFEMDIGVNGGENVACDMLMVEGLTEIWQRQGLDVRIDGKFMAGRLYAVSNYVHRKTGVNCLQLELSGHVRTEDEWFEKFYRGFLQVLEEVIGM